MAGAEIERLIAQLAKLPGLGPRSARRAALMLLSRKESALSPLIAVLQAAERAVRRCTVCGNLDSADPCAICADPERRQGPIVVVEQVADLWAIERSGAHRGRYHVLGGVLSPMAGVGPEDLAIQGLLGRVAAGEAEEVVLALGATVDGQATAHYIAERLRPFRAQVTRLAHGVPVGGELALLDDGTLLAALKARRPLG